jgi:hypothetical protein
MKRLRWFAFVTALQFCIAAPRAHHVMLSWKLPGQPWHFAFYSTLPLPYSARDLARPDLVVVGIPALKTRLSQHQPWRDIVWRDLVGSRPYPDGKTRDEILTFARAHSVNLEMTPTIVD